MFIDENNDNNTEEKFEVYKELADTLKRENALLRDKLEQKEQSNDSKNKKTA